MKIIVTGICGRIGREVGIQLKQLGHSVIGIDILKPEPALEGIEYISASLLDVEKISHLFASVDAVAHLAAKMSWSYKDYYSMTSQNIVATFNLLNEVVKHQNIRFVFASTGEVYPEVAPKYQPIDEKHPLQPTSYYGETKKISEDLVSFFASKHNLKSVILRFPHTQSADELLNPNSFFSGPRFFLQSKIKQLESLGEYETVKYLKKYEKHSLQHLLQCDNAGQSYKMHISDARDTAQGVVLALLHPDAEGEIFNVTTNEPVIFSELLKKMHKITGCEVVKVNMPGNIVSYHTSNEKIKKLLGYKQKYSIESMLKEAEIYWKNNMK